MQSIVLRSFFAGVRIPIVLIGFVLSLAFRFRRLAWRGAIFGIRSAVLTWLRPWILLFQITWLGFRLLIWLVRRIVFGS